MKTASLIFFVFSFQILHVINASPHINNVAAMPTPATLAIGNRLRLGTRRMGRQTDNQITSRLEDQFCKKIPSLLTNNACKIQNIKRVQTDDGPVVDFTIVLTTNTATKTVVDKLQTINKEIGSADKTFTTGVISNCSTGFKCQSCPGGQAFNTNNMCDPFDCGQIEAKLKLCDQGNCVGKVCNCNSGFGGVDCSLPLKPVFDCCTGDSCNQGVCACPKCGPEAPAEQCVGVCTCPDGFSGQDCSIQAPGNE